MKYDLNDAGLIQKLMPGTCSTSMGTAEYTDFGTGPAVVCLHGALGGWDQSLILAQTAGAAGFRYIALSRPGYLGTPMASGKNPEEQADLVAALLDRLKIPGAGVLAISGGGPCAINFGLRHPDRCLGLVLTSTCAGRMDARIPLSFKVTARLARVAWVGHMLHKKALKDTAAVAARSIRDPDIFSRTVENTDVWPLFSAMLLSTFDRMHLRMDGTMNDIRITQSTDYPLEDLKVPVLVVHGTQDSLLPFDTHALELARRIRSADLLTVEKGEHVAIFTHRDAVRPGVVAFMRQCFH